MRYQLAASGRAPPSSGQRTQALPRFRLDPRTPNSAMIMRRLFALVLASWLGASRTPAQDAHLNPIVDLLKAKQAVFGLYAPSNPRPRPGQSAPTAPPKSPRELAQLAISYTNADYIFDGSMEGNFDAGMAAFVPFVSGMTSNGKLPWTHPLVVKTPEIAADRKLARTRIAQQLNAGVSTIVFVDAQSAEEVRDGLQMMRFASQGGTRPDDIGNAPQLWGLDERAYRARADLWPLNPRGELVNWTIVESKEGLQRVRDIAAVKGIGVLFPGAGTLRGVFTSVDSTGKRVFDEAGWEAAIQQVLAACKEFRVPCGYPANLNDIELRMKQGFSVFVIGWGETGMKTIELGKKLAGR